MFGRVRSRSTTAPHLRNADEEMHLRRAGRRRCVLDTNLPRTTEGTQAPEASGLYDNISGGGSKRKVFVARGLKHMKAVPRLAAAYVHILTIVWTLHQRVRGWSSILTCAAPLAGTMPRRGPILK